MRAGECEITLADGRTVSNYSPEFVAWCEARTICRMHSRQARRIYMTRIEVKRGAAAREAMEALVHVVWQTEFGRTSYAQRAQRDGPPAGWEDSHRVDPATALQGGFAGF